MPKYTNPRKTWHYLNEFKVKAVQLSLLEGVQVKEVADERNRCQRTIVSNISEKLSLTLFIRTCPSSLHNIQG